jgi:GntR family transcriptional regulator, carbon starvation induced regulator
MPTRALIAHTAALPSDALLHEHVPSTDSARALRDLRSDIVSGRLQPTAKLKMRELTVRYGLGATPLREALAALAAEGYVVQEDQRGFYVPALSADDLDDITRSRQLVECEALRLAMVHGDAAWEAGIVAAFHRFERAIQNAMKQGLPADEAFEALHFSFHRALVAACPLPSLLAFSERLYRQGSRYRHLMMEDVRPSRDVIALHRQLRDLTLKRDKVGAVRALREHIAIPAALLTEKLARHMPSRRLQTNKQTKKRLSGGQHV